MCFFLHVQCMYILCCNYVIKTGTWRFKGISVPCKKENVNRRTSFKILSECQVISVSVFSVCISFSKDFPVLLLCPPSAREKLNRKISSGFSCCSVNPGHWQLKSENGIHEKHTWNIIRRFLLSWALHACLKFVISTILSAVIIFKYNFSV